MRGRNSAASHPECAQWKHSNFEFYEAMNQTFQGTFATGCDALSVKRLAEDGLSTPGEESTNQEGCDSMPPSKRRKSKTTLNLLDDLSQSLHIMAESFDTGRSNRRFVRGHERCEKL